jgi:hypothetical protein
MEYRTEAEAEKAIDADAEGLILQAHEATRRSEEAQEDLGFEWSCFTSRNMLQGLCLLVDGTLS